ncbi:MAG: dihydropyrimidinase [Chloroflexi bacterium]|nr:dihydropyrimidinase [Chloroflexota bacterium]
MDLVIRNGAVVSASDIQQVDVGVADGSVVALGQGLRAPHTLDARGCLVLPGFVDPHVHLQMGKGDLVSADGFGSGTAAAACGGTTTVIDFAEAHGATLRQAVAARRAAADGSVAVDYALHLTGNRADDAFLAEVRSLAQEGYGSLKLYTTYPGLMVDDWEMERLLEVCRDAGLLPLVHCEDHAMLEQARGRLLASGDRSLAAWPRSRPAQAEGAAAAGVLALAQKVGTPLYLVHVSAQQTLKALREARGRGQVAYAEVCPQHLLFSDEVYRRPDGAAAPYIYAPPSRGTEDRDALWAALLAGEIQTVATDHCPWNRYHCPGGCDDFTAMPAGGAGIEVRPTLLYTEGVLRRGWPLTAWVEACAAAPARLFGLYPRKGSLQVGADADIVVWDPQATRRLSQATLHSRVDHCPYEGWPVQGQARWVLVRGQLAAQDGQFVGRMGWGRWLPRRLGRAA